MEANERRHDYPTILEDLKEVKTDVKDIHKILVGNGKIGMCSKVDIMWHTTLFLVVGFATTVGVYLWNVLIHQ